MTSERIELLKYRLAIFQGIFYFITGIWPLVHMQSFMVVTGPKADLWLVRAVGLMIVATSVVLLWAARSKELTRSIALLAILNALFLSAIDIYYSLINRISDIYLLDAAVEIPLALAWIYLLSQENKQTAPLLT